MKFPSRVLALAVVVSALALAAGCITRIGYGRISPATPDKTIDDLVEDWRNYHVYYSGLNQDRPSGLMFDPRHDDRELMGNRWEPVNDRATLDKIVMWLRANDSFKPRLLRIIGPEQVLYGYVYTGWNQVVARAVDMRSMHVLGLPTPLPENRRSPGR